MKEIKTKELLPASCHCINLRRGAQAITDYYNKTLAPSNINLNQYSLLKHVKKLSPVNVSDLATAMRLDRTTMVRNLKPLMEKDYMIDMASNGKRDRQLQLTPRGLQTLKEATVLWEMAQEQIEVYLGKDNLSLLTDLIFQIECMP